MTAFDEAWEQLTSLLEESGLSPRVRPVSAGPHILHDAGYEICCLSVGVEELGRTEGDQVVVGRTILRLGLYVAGRPTLQPHVLAWARSGDSLLPQSLLPRSYLVDSTSVRTIDLLVAAGELIALGRDLRTPRTDSLIPRLANRIAADGLFSSQRAFYKQLAAARVTKLSLGDRA